jgi:beta-glucosidase
MNKFWEFARTLSPASAAVSCILILPPFVTAAPEVDSKKSSHATAAEVGSLPAALIPTARTDDSWMDKHKALAKAALNSHPGLAFFGDSITQGMNVELMHKMFGADSNNFGIRGDRTQQLLWRMQNGELQFAKPGPKTFVVLIGTNNLLRWKDIPASTTADTAAGVKANLDTIRGKFPEARILLLGILPRDEKPGTTTRRLVAETNSMLAKLADNHHIYFADIGNAMLEFDGKISSKVMPDFLHPSSDEGYTRMFSAIKMNLDNLNAQSKSLKK